MSLENHVCNAFFAAFSYFQYDELSAVEHWLQFHCVVANQQFCLKLLRV
jgi:hypothetical protein